MTRRFRSLAAAWAAASIVLAACSSGDDAAVDDAAVDDAAVDGSSVGIGSVPADVGSASTSTTSTVAPAPDVVATEPTKDVRTRSADAVGDGVQPEGFTAVSATVTAADGSRCTVCLWLADESDERARGLMGVTDLGGAVGMAFTWDEPTSGRFFMFQTPTPLSIAWFAADGSYVSEADMEPCLDLDSALCDRFEAAGDYLTAVEMFQGELGVIGIGPGSSIELLAASESADCPAAP